MKNSNVFTSKRKANIIKERKINETKNAISKHVNNFVTDQRRKDIAQMNENGFKDITEMVGSILNVKGKMSSMKKKPPFVDDTAIGSKLYENLNKNKYFEFMRNLSNELGNTGKEQSGSSLFENVKRYNTNEVNRISEVNYNRAKAPGLTDFQDLNKAVQNLKRIKKEGGYVASYDLESIGGINGSGHQQLDFITEISATMSKVEPGGKYSPAEQINSLLGFSATETADIKNHLKTLRDKPKAELTGRDNVLINRLSMMSNGSIDISKDNFEVQIAKSSNVTDHAKSSIDNAIKGAEVYEKIGQHQKEWVANNTTDFKGATAFEDYRKKYIKEASLLVHEGKGKVKTYEDFVTLSHNGLNFDKKMVGQALGQTINAKPGTQLDSFQATKYAEENLGQGAHIKGLLDSNGNAIKTSAEFGTGTQDQMKFMFGANIEKLKAESNIDFAQAHTARSDENILMEIMMNTSYADKMSDNFIKINQNTSGTKSTHKFEERDGIFLMDRTAQMERNSKTGAMSFVYNPTSKTFKMFDGFELDESGSVSKSGFPQSGPKKNALYKHEVFEINLNTENWKEQFKNLGMSKDSMDKFYQEYSTLDTMYLVKSKEYRNKKALEAKFGKNSVFEEGNEFYRVLTSKEEIATAMGVKVAHENGDESLDWMKQSLNGLDLKVAEQNGDKIDLRSVEGKEAQNMLIDRSLHTTTIDNGARAIRDMQYTRLEKIRQYNLANDLSVSQRIAKMASEGKTLGLDLKPNMTKELTEEFGWYDYKSKKMELVSESLGKATVLDNYVKEMNPIFEAINEVFEKTMKFDNSFETIEREDGVKVVKQLTGGATKTLNAKKDWLFKKAVNDVMEGLASSDDIINKPSAINNSRSVIGSASDYERLDFNTFKLFPELEGTKKRAGIGNASSEITSIDLTKKDALRRTFFSNQVTDPTASINGPQGFNSLFEAYERIGSDERFKGVWGDLTINDINAYQNSGESLSDLNNKMMNKLISFTSKERKKEGQSGFGLLFPREAQDPMRAISLLKGKDKKALNSRITKMVEDSIGSVDLKVLIADTNAGNSGLIDDIVDNYFMTFSKEDVVKNLDGLTDQQKNVLIGQYDFAKKEARASALEIVTAMENTDLNLTIAGSGNKAKMFMSQGNDIRTINAHKYSHKDGIITTQIGDQNYATKLTYNTNEYIKYGKPKYEGFDIGKHVTITNNVDAINGSSKNLNKVITDATASGRNILDDISYAFNTRAKRISESSPRKEVDNFANTFERAFQVDTNALVGILPELDERGIIDEITKQYEVPAQYAKMFKETIAKMKKGKVRPSSVAEMLSNDQNLYFQLYQIGLSEKVNSGIKFKNLGTDVDMKKVFSHINNYVKDTALTKGNMSLNDSPFPHGLAGFEKGTRPPQFQYGNPILKDKKELLAGIKAGSTIEGNTKEIFKHLSVDSIVSNVAAEKFMYNANGKTAGMTMKYLQIDSHSLRGIFAEDANKAREGKSNKFSDFLKGTGMSDKRAIEKSKILAEKSMSLSTYEQQSAMNSRVAYLGFNETNVQSINSKKQLLLNHKNNLDTIEELKVDINKLYPSIDAKGNIVYTSGVEVKHGQLLGLFGDDAERITAKTDGVFRSRYYNNGELVSEATLNKTIHGMTDHSKIINKLDNTFERKYEVIQKYDTYGKKIFTEATEKTTMDSMDIRVGQIDDGLMDALKFKLKGTGVDARTLEDTVLSKSYTEEFLRPLIGGDLTERLLTERFTFADSLGKFTPLNGVSQILAVDNIKHQSIAMGLTDILNNISNDPNKDEYFNAMLGKDKWKYGANGKSILTDNLDGIKISGFTKADFGDDVIKASRMNTIVNKVDWVYGGKDGKEVIGHTGLAHVTQMRDDSAGTYAGNIDGGKVSKDLKAVERKLGATNLSAEGRLKLEQQASGLRAALDMTDNYKGVKFSNNMNNLLQRAVYDQDTMGESFKHFNNMGLNDEYSKYFGHAVDATGTVNKEMLGKSILDPITAPMRAQLKKGYGETLLSDVDSMDKKTRKKYEYLTDSFGKIKKEISVERAEQAYSVNQGIMAIKFNEHFDNGRLEQLTTNGPEHSQFKMVDMLEGETLSLDKGGQGKTITSSANNPYTNNLMIKYGPNEYLAIPRMPEKHFGDSLIKKEHISKLTSLERIMGDINSGNYVGEDLANKQKNLESVVANIKQLQKKDITSKSGLIGDISEIRMSQSFFGKASGITMDTLGQNLDNLTKGNSADFYKRLQYANSSMFDKAQFNGKSLMKHLSEGKVLDHVYVSKQAFENMGYFDEDYMAKIFKKMDVKQSDMINFAGAKDIANKKAFSKADVATMKSSMMDLLETHGDSFISVRYPELQEGSDKVLMGYLNRDLKPNQILVPGHTGLSMNLDHDGDQAAIARTSTKGSYLDYAVNTTSADKQLIANVNATNSIMMKRAVLDNHMWNDKVQEKIQKEADVARLATMKDGQTRLDVIAGNRKLFDNKVFGSVMPTSDMSASDLAKIYSKHKDNIKESMASTETDPHKAVVERFKQESIIDGKLNEEMFEATKQDYRKAYSFQIYKDEAVAKSSKTSIGEINVTNKKIGGIMQSLIDTTDNQYDYKTKLMNDFAHLSEQAVISSKSDIEGLSPDRAKVWNTGIFDLVTGSGNEQKIREGLGNWTEEYIHKDIDLNSYYKNAAFREKAHAAFGRSDFDKDTFKEYVKDDKNLESVNNLKKEMSNDYIDTMSTLRNEDNVKKMFEQMSSGQSKSGVIQGIDNFISTDFETNRDQLRYMLENMESANQDLNFINVVDKLQDNKFSAGTSVGNIIDSAERNSSKKSFSHAILEGAGDFFKGVKSSGLAMGALGIAAGIMAVGFVGGRPRPADVHAMEEAEDYEAPMNGGTGLADPGLAFNQGSGQGYVVNINAKSDKGRDHAVSALQEALSSGTSSNINVSMNINDNYGNINNRDLEKAMAEVLR